MLLAASVLLIGGYTLLYAGVRGIEWQHPWNILIGNTPRPAGPVTASGTPVQTAPTFFRRLSMRTRPACRTSQAGLVPSRGERILAAELIGSQVIITAHSVSDGVVPSPRRYFAGLVVYGGLSGVALLSDQAAEFAAAFGGLVLLATLLSFPGFFEWLAGAAGGPTPTIVQAPRPKGTSAGTGGVGGIIGATKPGGGAIGLLERVRNFLLFPQGGGQGIIDAFTAPFK